MPSFNIHGLRDQPVPVPGANLTDAEGRHAHIASIHVAGDELTALIRADDGDEIMLPADVLLIQDDGSYILPFALHERVPAAARGAGGTAHTLSGTGAGSLVIPVIEEQLKVGKRVVDSGRGVRVQKQVIEQEQQIDLPLVDEELQVERVPVGTMVAADALPTPRYEGDVYVVPVLEEVLVVEKRIRLVEEVRIHRIRHEQPAQQSVIVRSERVDVEHFDEREDGYDDDERDGETRYGHGPGSTTH